MKININDRTNWREIRPLLSEMFWSLVGLSAMLMGAIHGIKGMWHRGDGVSDHFCIGRLIKLGEPYWEYWNKGRWVSAGEVFIGREAAQAQLDRIRDANGNHI